MILSCLEGHEAPGAPLQVFVCTQPVHANTPGFEGPGTSARGCGAFHTLERCKGPSSYFPILILQGAAAG